MPQLVNQTLATLASLQTDAAMAAVPSPGLSEKDKTWCRRFLKLETFRHPELIRLEFEACKFCTGYFKNPARGRLLVIYGNNGVGKSMVAENIVTWAHHARANFPKIVVGPGALQNADQWFVRWPKFLDDLKNGSWELVDAAEAVSLLVLDELGGAYDPSGIGTDKLCRILSRREKKWTIITTNLDPASWETSFDRRIASRLYRNAIHVEMNNVQDYGVA